MCVCVYLHRCGQSGIKEKKENVNFGILRYSCLGAYIHYKSRRLK